MSKHYRNPLMSLSPRTTNSTSYTVPKFEKTHNRSSSFSSPEPVGGGGGGSATTAATGSTASISSSSLNQNTTNTPTMRFTMPPSPITTPNQRSRSYTAPSVVTPNQSFESSSQYSFADDEQSALSVIGMPSGYPVYHRDDSVSSFASSVCSSLLMEELDDFEEFFGRELSAPPKVYDSHGCSSSDESPLKNERSRANPPPLPLVPRPTHVKARAVSEPTLQSSPQSKRQIQRPNIISTRVVSDSSTDSTKSRRRRNIGMDEKDFAQLTNEFSYVRSRNII